MAQIEKYTLQQAKAIIAHVERTGATHSNTCIDMTLTGENFALWPPESPDRLVLDTGITGQSSGHYAYRRLKKRLSEVSVLQRKDVNVLCDWCIHLGVDVPPGYESKREFFEAAVRVLARLYGSQNVVYAWVHEDETSSHLHFGFVPVVRKELKLRNNASQKTREAYERAVRDGNTVVERVDAAAVINRKHLKGWHGWMTKKMVKELGYDPGIHTGVTQYLGGNATVPQLKRTGPNWRKKRNAQVAAFHENRRAAASGRKPGLDTKITMSRLDQRHLQRTPGINPANKRALSDIIKDADSRSGLK